MSLPYQCSYRPLLAVIYDALIVALLRSQTGKLHLAAASGGTACSVRSGDLVALKGTFGDVTCALCMRQIPRAGDGPASTQPAPWGSREATSSSAPTTPSAAGPSATRVAPTEPAPSSSSPRTSPDVVAPVDAPDPLADDPLAAVKRAIAPVSFAALGGVAAIWMLRRRRRR